MWTLKQKKKEFVPKSPGNSVVESAFKSIFNWLEFLQVERSTLAFQQTSQSFSINLSSPLHTGCFQRIFQDASFLWLQVAQQILETITKSFTRAANKIVGESPHD